MNKIIAIDINNTLINSKLADYYYDKDFKKSLFHYNVLINTKNFSKETYKKVANIYQKLGDFDKEREFLFYEKIYDLKYQTYYLPSSADSYYNLSNAYRLEGKFDDAILQLNNALKVDSSYNQAIFSLEDLYNEKIKQQKNNIYIYPFKVAYLKNTRDINTISNLANAYMKILDFDNAEKIYTNYLKINDNPKIYNNLSRIYKIKSNLQLKELIRINKLKEYKKILQYSPYNHKEFYDLAMHLKNQGKINDSIAGLEESIRINPYESNYHLQLAYFYKESNNIKNYNLELKLACKLGSINSCNILNK
ncbi:MAG: hypothetical protein U0354_05645 [Candidatus Sericytochromatia bacterium]